MRSVSHGVKYSGLEHCHHSHFFRVRIKKDGCPQLVREVWGYNVWSYNVWSYNVWGYNVWSYNIWSYNVWGYNPNNVQFIRLSLLLCMCSRLGTLVGRSYKFIFSLIEKSFKLAQLAGT
jgi:hypothetical protein